MKPICGFCCECRRWRGDHGSEEKTDGGQTICTDSDTLESERERYPTAPVRDLTVYLSVGRYISEIPLPAASLLYREQEGDGAIWRVTYWVDCDENNQTFYAEEGRLYLRADNQPVTQLSYGEDG